MPYLKRINSLPLINHISYKYAQVSDIGPSWSSCLSVAMATRVLHRFESLKFSESASPKDHFCEVSLKSVVRFQREDSLSNCSRTDGYADGRTDRRPFLQMDT